MDQPARAGTLTPRALASVSALTALALAPALWARAGDALVSLDHARRETVLLSAEASSPPVPAVPLVTRGRAIGSNAARAQQALADRLTRAAAHEGVLLEQIVPEKQAAPTVAATIIVTGSEPRVTAFARMIEAGEPLVRFASWRLDRRDGGGPLRLEAQAVALRGGA